MNGSLSMNLPFVKDFSGSDKGEIRDRKVRIYYISYRIRNVSVSIFQRSFTSLLESDLDTILSNFSSIPATFSYSLLLAKI